MAELDFALTLADLADDISMARYRAQDLAIETKPDLTPVTEADRETELKLRQSIQSAYPMDGILGEEFGAINPEANRVWILDPIDGTKNYVRGVPVWATLISLVENNQPIVGVVSSPALGRRWWASKNSGAFTQDCDGTIRKLAVSKVSNLADASFSYSDEIGWENFGNGNAFSNLKETVWRTRAYGDFWSHLLVAEGAVDVAAEPSLNKWDMAANNIIVSEAGGKVTGFHGGDPFEELSALTTNGLLHDACLTKIKN
jgi:histidinol-phosphatase